MFFAGVGFGFIFFEITLMQLLNLFLGFPTSSLTVTLMASSCSRAWGLSSASGCPDRPSPGHPRAAGSGRRLFYLFGLTPLTNALLSPPLAVRILITLVVLAPLGLCLGMLMPLGLGEISRLGDLPRAYVAWGWAVNGFASVVGSVLATILAMSFG